MKKVFMSILVLITSFSLISCKKEEKPEFKFEKNEITITVGEEIEFKYELTKGFDVNFTIGDDKIVSVEGNKVKGLEKGETTIKGVVDSKKHEVKDTLKVIVKEKDILAESIKITGLNKGEVGEKITLKTEVTPANTTNKNVIWETSDKEIATVSNGVVTLLEEGVVEITAKIDDVLATHEITVNSKGVSVEEIKSINYKELYIGEEKVIEVVVSPENASVESMELEVTAGKELVEIDGFKIKALKAGKVEVNIKIKGIEKKFEIEVKESKSPVAFIGDIGYDTIQTAVNRAEKDDVIKINAGTYKEALKIENSDLTITSKDGEVILTNKIQLTKELSNLTFKNLTFTGKAQIQTYEKIDNLVFTNNKVENITLKADAYDANRSRDVEAFIRLFVSSGVNIIGDVLIENNIFENISSDIISIARTAENKKVVINNNEFYNFPNTAIRFDGGFNNGEIEITNNSFINDETPSQSAILFRTYGGNRYNKQVINIENNYFQNIGDINNKEQSDNPGSAVIAGSNYMLYEVEFNILNNVFEDTAQTIYLKNFTKDIDTWTANINYNEFINTKRYAYRELHEKANLDYNLFLDQDGKPVIGGDELFNLINTGVDYKKLYDEKINLVIDKKHSNQVVELVVKKDAKENEKITLNDVEYVYGETLFNSISKAIEKANDDSAIYILKATYEEDITINKSIRLLGESQEVIIKGKLNIDASLTTLDTLVLEGTITNIGKAKELILVNVELKEELLEVKDLENLFIKESKLENINVVNLKKELLVFSSELLNVNISESELSNLEIINSEIKTLKLDNVKSDKTILVNYNTFKTTKEDVAINISKTDSKIEVNYNIFNEENSKYIKSVEGNKVDATKNIYVNETFEPKADKFENVEDYNNYYKNMEDLPKYKDNLIVFAESIKITNKIDEIMQLDKHIIETIINPSNASDNKVIYVSSNDRIVQISNLGEITAIGFGKVEITAMLASNEEIFDTFTLNVKEYERVDIINEGPLAAEENETFEFELKKHGFTKDVTFTSSNEDVASITTEGVLTANKPGNTTITIKLGDKILQKFDFLVYAKDIDPLLKDLILASKAEADTQLITYYGATDHTHLITHSVSNYIYSYETDVVRNMIPTSHGNNPNRKLDSLEWIVIHDTANTNTGAKGNSDYANNPSNTGSSWHYTIGNDGVYQQLEDNMVGWHAGDGTRVSFEFYKTNIKATKLFPKVTISKNGKYEIEGIETEIYAPSHNGKQPETSDINTNGIRAVVGEDGYYYLPKTGRHAYGNRIGMYGGNLNSIGIETAVDRGSDVWLTWHMTARLTAELLIKHNLGLDRVVTHNHFSNKECPKTMMRSGNLDNFYKMVEVEYEILKNHLVEEQKVEFSSTNLEVLDSNGRIISTPMLDETVSYEISVTNKEGVTTTVKLDTIVKGSYFNK